jgi:ribosomal protein S18 acetylase RimI-like enzyme
VNRALELDAGEDAGPLLDAILPIYSEVYVEPPYCEGPDDVTEFAESWPSRVASQGFRLVRAFADGRPVGFTFGHELSERTAWWDGALSPLPADVVTEQAGRTFAIIELAVLREFRRRGVARALHDRLLDGIRAERVTLLVRPEPSAAPAQAAYHSWGYRELGRLQPGPETPVYNLMLRELRLT